MSTKEESTNKPKSVSTNESALGAVPKAKPKQSLFSLFQSAPQVSTKPPHFYPPSSMSFNLSLRSPLEKKKVNTGPLYSEYVESRFEWSYDNPKKMETALAAKGIFSFGLFRNYLDLQFKADLYREGISKYIELTKRKEFEEYVVVVYVDESVINNEIFSNEKYYKDLLTEYYIQVNYDDKYDFEEKMKYVTSPQLSKENTEEIHALNVEYTKQVDQLKTRVTNQQTSEWTQEMKRINGEFKQLVNELRAKYDLLQEEFREKYLEEQLQKSKQGLDEAISNLIGSIKVLLDTLTSEPTCILCKYTIPTFLIPGTPFHYNYIGSMVRFQAIAQFPEKRVCVRDADTYFPNLWTKVQNWPNTNGSVRELSEDQKLQNDIAEHYVDYLAVWETNLMNYHGKKNLPFLIAYDTNYGFTNMRNSGTLRNSRFLAGIVDAFPHGKELFTQEDWENGLRFLRDDKVIYNIRGNKQLYHKERQNFKHSIDLQGMTYYGCDEKVLRYVYFEKWKGQTVLFYFPYAHGSNLLLFSTPDNDASFLNIYSKLLESISPQEEKNSSLYKYILRLRDHLFTIPMLYRDQGGKVYVSKNYYFFASSYPFIADQLAAEADNMLLENIKPYVRGGSLKTRKVYSHKRRKSKKQRKSRKH